MNNSDSAVTFFFGKRILGRLEFAPEDSHHLVRVLRHHEGDVVWAIDGSGTAFEVELESISPRHAAGIIVGEHPRFNELPQNVSLVCGMLQPGKMDWLVEKAVELGVSRVHTVNAKVAPGPGRLRRWSHLARSAAKQCKRGYVPVIEAPAPLEEVLAMLPESGCRLLADPHGAPELPDLSSAATITVAVGPEKGFSSSDIAAFQEARFSTISLGSRRLRAETASISILSLVSQTLEMAGSGS